MEHYYVIEVCGLSPRNGRRYVQDNPHRCKHPACRPTADAPLGYLYGAKRFDNISNALRMADRLNYELGSTRCHAVRARPVPRRARSGK